MSLVGNTNSRGEVQGNLSAPEKMSGSISLPKMIQGKSAYEIAVIFGFKGTEEEWLASLKGKDGEKGDKGNDGKHGYSIFTTDYRVNKITSVTATIDTALLNYYDARGFQRGDIVFDTKSGELWQIDGMSGSLLALLLVYSFSSGTSAAAPVRIAEIHLPSANWVGAESPYSQVVTIDGITENSMVNLQPSAEQLSTFHDKDLAFVAENEDGVVTVYAIGDKPLMDYTIQVSITEVYE